MFLIKKNNFKFFQIYLLLIIIVFFNFELNAEENRGILKIGNGNAKVTIKVFSSLTCPHCANFHTKIFKKLKKEHIDKGKVNMNIMDFLWI